MGGRHTGIRSGSGKDSGSETETLPEDVGCRVVLEINTRNRHSGNH